MRSSLTPRHRAWPWVVILAATAILATAATGSVPRKINYQGRITEAATGQPLPGAHTMTFVLYDDAAGGSALWQETQAVTADSAGVVAVVLGSTDRIDISFAGSLWLSVEVDGQVLEPRREMVSVPYALNAMQVNGIGASATPQPNTLLPLDGGARVPLAVLPEGVTPGAHAATHSAGGADAITVTSAVIQNGTILGEDLSDNSISAPKIQPDLVSSVEGVSNDGGNIDLVPGSNISISANDAANTITISATGLATGDITAVNAGTGLDGGGISGDVAIAVEVPLLLSSSVASGGVISGTNSSSGSGVYGYHSSTGNSGYLGTNTAGVYGTGDARGVEGYSENGTGSRGASNHGSGVFGYSIDSVGVDAYTPGGAYGVRGESGRSSGCGVYGLANGDTNSAGVLGHSVPGTGVIGASSQQTGVVGITYGQVMAGVKGIGMASASVGVDGSSLYGTGVAGTDAGASPDDAYAIWSQGDTRVTDDLFVDDDLNVNGFALFNAGKSGYVVDVAQNDGHTTLEAGDVVVISGSGPAVVGEIPLVKVRRAESAEAHAVIGVVDRRYESTSRPAVTKDGPGVKAEIKLDDGPVLPGDYMTVVTLGSFRTIKVDASYGAVEPGDLLVTSPNPGYAMRAESPKPGTVIGKALDGLDFGTGTIPVVVTLQ